MQTQEQIDAMSLGAKRAAYKEAHTILQTGKKWQRLVPGERRPDFERAARHVLHKALRRPVRGPPKPFVVHNGLMHEHAPREARRIERYLKSGMLHPDVLHSFRSGRVTRKPRPVRFRGEPLRQDDQDVEHVVLDRLAGPPPRAPEHENGRLHQQARGRSRSAGRAQQARPDRVLPGGRARADQGRLKSVFVDKNSVCV